MSSPIRSVSAAAAVTAGSVPLYDGARTRTALTPLTVDATDGVARPFERGEGLARGLATLLPSSAAPLGDGRFAISPTVATSFGAPGEALELPVGFGERALGVGELAVLECVLTSWGFRARWHVCSILRFGGASPGWRLRGRCGFGLWCLCRHGGGAATADEPPRQSPADPARNSHGALDARRHARGSREHAVPANLWSRGAAGGCGECGGMRRSQLHGRRKNSSRKRLCPQGSTRCQVAGAMTPGTPGRRIQLLS